MSWADRALIAGFVVVFTAMFGAAVWAIFRGMRAYDRRALTALSRILEETKSHLEPLPGDVVVTFHTYHGLMFLVTQIEHQFALPPKEALNLLQKLHRFNLRWGLWGCGGIYVPFFTFGNFWAQRRSIRKQASQQSGGASPMN